MVIINCIEDFYISSSVVALGKFDGVHLGHQAIINELKRDMKDNVKSVVITFSVSPEAVLSRKDVKYLMTDGEKQSYFEKMGIDYLIDIKLDRSFLNMEADIFVKEYLVDRLGIKKVVCGSDFRFGKGRRGDISFLCEYGKKFGFETCVVNHVCMGNSEISSTKIRDEIAAGNIAYANKMLGHPYLIEGRVEHGRALGRTLDFPTANIFPPEEKLLPPNGVYVSACIIAGKRYKSITNIGVNPTVGQAGRKRTETNIFDFQGDLYGRKIGVELYEFLREEKQFATLNALKEQIAKDVDIAKKRAE